MEPAGGVLDDVLETPAPTESARSAGRRRGPGRLLWVAVPLLGALAVLVPTARAGLVSTGTNRPGAGPLDQSCTFLDVRCPTRLQYRPVDGTCNNLVFPWLGAANTPLMRMLRPEYGNGTGAPRLSRRGTTLPSAQEIVTRLLPQADHQAVTTHLFVIWGQLLIHDIALINTPRIQPRGPCCEKDAGKHCMQIPVAKNDPFYRQFDVECLPLERTNTSACGGSHPEQTSLVTHFVDASFVYGSDENTTRGLRTLDGGKLLVRCVGDGKGLFEDFLPLARNATPPCDANPCYQSGDVRVSQNPMLAALQTLWLREHNRVAGVLGGLNPHWKDERLFQEARRIVVAEWQLITYRDWLQWLLGRGRAHALGLVPAGSSPRSAYAADTDPRTANDVTTAALRALHSMVQGAFWLGPRGARVEPLAAWLFNPTPLLERDHGLLDVLQGLVYQQSQARDRWMDNQITQQSEPTKTRDGRQWGTNLAAVDIQRGRDHGLPGYVKYRRHVGLPPAWDFDDLVDTISEEDVEVLKEVYEHVDDIDYYVGGLLERRKQGASLLGPTTQPMLEDQFWRWRFGDRFFYNFVGFDHSFSEEQILALEGTSVARLLCDNVRGFKRAPRDTFVKTDFMGNEDVSCRKLRGLDLSSWRENNHQRNRY